MRAASFSEDRQPLKIDVVSVQSQVVYGRVGNNAAVPTLEALGLTVAAVPTVVLSNIPSYPSIHGGALPVEWFDGYLQDLSARGALNALRAVQVGYLGNAGQAVALRAWIETLLANRPHLRVVIDPVIGDQEHGIYSADGIADVYRGGFTALANGLTPNAFELACLTGMPADDLKGVVSAARSLLTGRTEWVAVTSAVPDSWTPDEMWIVVVTERQVHLIRHPRVAVALAGTGDLFSACLTGHWLNGVALEAAAAMSCEHVVRALRITELAQAKELVLPRWSFEPEPEEIFIHDITADFRHLTCAFAEPKEPS